MKTRRDIRKQNEFLNLCTLVRNMVLEENYDLCIKEICKAMELYPHSPEPHNLLGIVLEKMGRHTQAMKHFRAAWALDSSYLPARHNLRVFGTFFTSGKCAFDENDLYTEGGGKVKVENGRQGTIGLSYKNKMFMKTGA